MKKEFIKEDTNIIDDELTVTDLKKKLTNNNLLITKHSFDANLEISNNCTLLDVKIMIKGQNSTLIIEDGAELIDCSIYANGNNNYIFIGKNCRLKGTYIMCCDEGNSIIINESTTTNGEFWGNVFFHTIEQSKIEIGTDCMLSGNIVIRTTDGHAIINSKGKRINPPKNIKIDNHVWVGMNSMILKGTHIAKGCIVGANSVVSHLFSNPYTIIAGNPAKKIRKKEKFDWNRKRGFDFSENDYRIH